MTRERDGTIWRKIDARFALDAALAPLLEPEG